VLSKSYIPKRLVPNQATISKKMPPPPSIADIGPSPDCPCPIQRNRRAISLALLRCMNTIPIG
jgi:hypothetical protein